MELKKEIESLLIALKSKGYDRRKIEQALDYSEHYIDQQVSRGGNTRLLNALKKLNASVLQIAIPQPDIKRDPRDQELIDSLYARIDELKSQVSLNDFAETLIRIESKLDAGISIKDQDEAFPRSNKQATKKNSGRPGKSS
jgi:hypothetical protein